VHAFSAGIYLERELRQSVPTEAKQQILVHQDCAAYWEVV
jgi:hypothetical protein